MIPNAHTGRVAPKDVVAKVRQEGINAVPCDSPEACEAISCVEDLSCLHYQQHVFQYLRNGITLEDRVIIMKELNILRSENK